MTMHEALSFVRAQHSAFVARASNPGPQCWPTWETTLLNLRLNRAHFGNERALHGSFSKQVKIAQAKGWLTVGPCQHHCHARHVALTTLGAEMLDLMDREGCHTDKFRKCALGPLTVRQAEAA